MGETCSGTSAPQRPHSCHMHWASSLPQALCKGMSSERSKQGPQGLQTSGSIVWLIQQGVVSAENSLHSQPRGEGAGAADKFS